MKFSELNPQMGASIFEGVNQLVFNCPVCNKPVSILCWGKEPDEAKRIWKITHQEGRYNWDSITLQPSISEHSSSKKDSRCIAHFSVIEGEIK